MEIFIVAVFILGYCAIAFEHFIKVNKAASALITGVLCWTVYILFSSDKVAVSGQLSDHMGQLSGILFFLSYCAGNGGSILIIGSAAGVAAMGMEKIHFFWYLRKITFFALLGYFAGALTFILQQYLF